MRLGRKTREVFTLPALVLLAGLAFAQGARVRVVAKGQAQDNASAENEQFAKGRVVFGESCIQCHSMTTVLIQRKPEQEWRQTVLSMISRGAQLTPDEIEPLIAYLAATYGPDSSPPSHATSSSGTSAEAADEESLPAGAGKQILSRACVKCHDLSLVTSSRKSEAEWVKTIARMVKLGSGLAPTEQQTLAQYLTKNYGEKK